MAGWEGETSTGLLDDADITIEQGYFGTDASYRNGEVLVWFLEGESPQSDEPIRQFYSIGSGWETSDNGETVEGRDEFNTQSNYFRFFRAAIDLDGVLEIVKARGNDPAVGGLWNGLKFHMERQEIIPENDNIKPWWVLLPVAFLGEVGEDKPAKEAKKMAKDNKGADNPRALLAKIRSLAKKADDYEAFLDSVHDKYPEVTDNNDLYDRVLNEEDIFAEAQG